MDIRKSNGKVHHQLDQEEEDLLASDINDEFLDVIEEENHNVESKSPCGGGDKFDNLHKMDIYEPDDEEEEEFHLFNRRFWGEVWHFKYCSMMTYICLAVFLMAALITVTIVIMLLLVPYIRVAHFEESLCNVTATTEHVTESLCSCEEDCDFLIPCLLIEVLYKDSETQSLHNAIIYDNELLLDLTVRTLFVRYMFCFSSNALCIDGSYVQKYS